jgi:eukaryotic-like serine/threonine-protein kinase
MATDVNPIESILAAAVEIGSDAQRRAYVEQACGGDEELKRRVQQMIEDHFRAGSFLESGAGDLGRTADQGVAERPGTVIGPYKLLQQIGEGGMGVVWMAEQTEPVKRKVALKVIKPGMDSRHVIARFEAERQALAMMDHVNIARVFDGGTTGDKDEGGRIGEKDEGGRMKDETNKVSDSCFRLHPSSFQAGRPYFVMELVHGVPITKYCDDNHLTPRQRLELFVPVCQAIQHAHQKGIIHRDIKPSNVMVTLYDGKPVPKVIDFGVAKATEQKLTERTLFTQYGTMVGTLEYMSPEQAEMSALGVDTRSDIYSLGVLLYELLTGSTPLTNKRMKEAGYGEILRMIKEEEPPKPSTRLSDSGEALASISANRQTEPAKLTKLVKGELDWIVMKTLEKDRNRRYESASALAADVQRYLNDEPVQACPPTAGYRLRKFVRRNQGPVAAGVALATLLVLGTVGTSIGLAWALRAERTATQAKGDLKQTLNNELHDAYFRRIALAYRELSADNLGGALKHLGDCPEDLRKWEWDLLMRLCRVEQVVLRNGAGVTSLAFSADGKRIATASLNGTLKVWHLATRKVIWFTEKAHGVVASKVGFASSVTFHRDGNHLASTGEDKLVKVWDLTTDRMVFSRPCDSDQMVGTAYSAAFNPLEPNQLAVGSEGTLTIWDWKNEKRIHTYPAHERRRLSVAFSRDGGRLASGDWSGNVKLWNAAATGEPLRTFPETRYAVPSLSFSPDGTRLATASFDRHVDVWNTTTGERVHRLPHSGRLVLAVAHSPDGRLIVSTGEGKTVHVWEAESGREVREVLGLRGHTGVCGCVAFSPDGLRLASASLDGTVRVWDATPLKSHERQESSTLTELGGEIWSLAVHPKGPKIALAGQGNPAKVWDVETDQVTARSVGLRDVVFCVAWHPDGERIAVAGGNGDQFTVEVWNTQNGQKYSLPFELEYMAAAFSNDGRYLLTGRGNGKVQIWAARDGREIGVLGAHFGVVRGVAFSPEPQGRYLVSASVDGSVKLWDATRLGEIEKTGPQKPLRTFPVHSPGVGLNVAFSPDGKRLAVADTEYTVKIWEVETGKELATLRGHSGDVYTVAFSPLDGRWVASAGEDSTVKVWDSHTGKLIRSFRGHTGLVNSLAFTSDGRRLVTGSRDRTVKFWDVQLSESRDSSSK